MSDETQCSECGMPTDNGKYCVGCEPFKRPTGVTPMTETKLMPGECVEVSLYEKVRGLQDMFTPHSYQVRIIKDVLELLEGLYRRAAPAPAPAPGDAERAIEIIAQLDCALDWPHSKRISYVASLLAAVRADERERCAKVCDAVSTNYDSQFDHLNDASEHTSGMLLGMAEGAAECAAAIRGKP